MGIVDIILGRKSVYRLRKTYDRLREKADRTKPIEKRIAILHFLDQLEPTLISLEEQMLPNFERRRMSRYVNDSLKKAQKMLKSEEYFTPMIGQQSRTNEGRRR